jgi:putative transposase
MALILSIDKSQKSQDQISDQLDKLGHTVVTAHTGEKGLDLARTGNPDLILVDVNMPDMDGFEVLENLKGHEITKDIPIIMQCDTAKKDDVLNAMRYGIIDYLIKSLDVNIFRRKIDAALEYSKIHRDELEARRISHIHISYQTGKTIVSIRTRLRDKNVIAEAKKKLNETFLDITRNDLCILDLRYLPELEMGEVQKIKDIIDLIPDRRLYIVAGRHYGTIMMGAEFEERIQIFISYGDMEIYSFSEGEEFMDEELTGMELTHTRAEPLLDEKGETSERVSEKRSRRFSESQILNILREAESGEKVGDLCKKYGMSDSTFYNWKNKYGGREISNLIRLRELDEENKKLKQIVADQVLEIHTLKNRLGGSK